MRSILKTAAALSATATLVLVAGCGGSAEPGADYKSKSKKPAAGTPPRKSYDPPQKFAAKGVALPEAAGRGSITRDGTVARPLPLALHGTSAYIAAADCLQVLDTGTGKTTATVRPRRKPVAESDAASDAEPGAPVLTQDGELMLVPFLVEFPGKGTTPSRVGIELDAVDTRTEKIAWTVDLDDLPSWDGEHDTLARVVAATKSTAVVSTYGGHAVTYAVDLGTRKTAWRKEHVGTAAVIGDTAVSVTSKDSVRQQVIGLDINHDGKQIWKKLDGYELTAHPAGPHLIAITGNDYTSGDAFSTMLTADGSKAADLSGDLSELTCRYDDASVLICQTGEPRTLALNATTGKQLWTLPEKGTNRIAPTVTAAWHGVVYGTTGNGPVALDAKTGADRSTSPGAAPVAVNEYTGVALDQADHRTLIAHPATG
ncbi:PQQ-binding-like beta-propeller repeat protein [Streptomyces sp. NPDC048637]|uniref:outer membrane protein assembly factor BamB family protein n=1 Tax=Streptomyces sp. NPDC048637 TaxID=3155636 RepID=UPI00342D82A5